MTTYSVRSRRILWTLGRRTGICLRKSRQVVEIKMITINVTMSLDCGNKTVSKTFQNIVLDTPWKGKEDTFSVETILERKFPGWYMSKCYLVSES